MTDSDVLLQWLFAPNPAHADTLRRVIGALRAAAHASWSPRVVVQVGTVAAAREAAELGADVIVAQGADAGGHQFVTAAGVVSLVPEICDSELLPSGFGFAFPSGLWHYREGGGGGGGGIC